MTSRRKRTSARFLPFQTLTLGMRPSEAAARTVTRFTRRTLATSSAVNRDSSFAKSGRSFMTTTPREREHGRCRENRSRSIAIAASSRVHTRRVKQIDDPVSSLFGGQIVMRELNLVRSRLPPSVTALERGDGFPHGSRRHIDVRRSQCLRQTSGGTIGG